MDELRLNDEAPTRLPSIASRACDLVGWILIGSSLSSLLFIALPVKLIDPAWQLQLISAILASTTFLLLGTLLVCGATWLNAKSRTLQQRSDFVRRAAGWFAVLLLVLIPYQLYAGNRASGVVQATENKSIQLIKNVIRGVTATSSEPELRSFLASLPTPPPVPAKFDAPFGEIKQRLLINFNSQLNAANYQAGELRRQRLERFIADVTRNSVQAVLMAIAFTGIAEQFGPLLGLFRRIGLFRYRD
ncbi:MULTISPECIES: hypothetical protein [unclassified Cyanobium]|uniref:hypothetical protein n=1 Tax=unclassified Cyanobium TaxID=2627006 RepID=UPI0020CC0EB3|nr:MULTISPECIES: hypothetical protein [unclassified Cyanobium]MCP9834494.1 hypothetical protein [Cyanobium sp. La Preciosa 7G6]MCP9937134.1 hypothetical protein [Cyanobium sp. Aljojuca 7A6]